MIKLVFSFFPCLTVFMVCFSFFTIQFAQVAPHDLPIGLEYPGAVLKSSEIKGEIKYPIDFINRAHLTILPDRKIWRIQLNFNSSVTGYLSISKSQIPNNSKLFFLSGNNTYSGPFLSTQGRQFLSGRFTGEKITLEYQEPATADFEGSFTIDGILPEFRPQDEWV